MKLIYKQDKINGYLIVGTTAYSSAYRLTRQPSEKTIKKLKSNGITKIKYRNGNFINI